MKFLHITIGVAILLPILLVFVSLTAQTEERKNIQKRIAEVIEKDVRNALEASEETMVIILLKEPEGLRKKPAYIIKETIRQIQDAFLLNLTDDDFKLTHRNEITPILIGELTRSGLKKVEKILDMVRSITKPKPVKAL